MNQQTPAFPAKAGIHRAESVADAWIPALILSLSKGAGKDGFVHSVKTPVAVAEAL